MMKGLVKKIAMGVLAIAVVMSGGVSRPEVVKAGIRSDGTGWDDDIWVFKIIPTIPTEGTLILTRTDVSTHWPDTVEYNAKLLYDTFGYNEPVELFIDEYAYAFSDDDPRVKTVKIETECDDREGHSNPAGVLKIGGYAFNACHALTEIKCQSNVKIKTIDQRAFEFCGELKTIDLTEVENIGNEAFYECEYLEKIKFNEIESIGDSAFYNCRSLQEVDFGDWEAGTCSIAANAFAGVGVDGGANNPVLLLPADWKGGEPDEYGEWNGGYFRYVKSMSITDETIILTEGEDKQLTAEASPIESENKAVTWSSSDESVATVDENGKVTAVSAGNATITVTSAIDKRKTATCSVTVNHDFSGQPYEVIEDGKHRQECKYCGAYNDAPHNYKTEYTVDVEPTCEVTGRKSIHCINCADKKDETELPPLGHDYVDGVCSRDGIISLKLCKDINIDVKSVKFNETAQTPEVTVTYKDTKLIKDTDYILSVDSKTDIGTYELTVEGIGNYREIVKEAWSISPASGIYCKEISDQVYTGKAINPEIEVYCEGVLLELGKDYIISYGKYNTNVATKDATINGKSVAPSVTITGIGNYGDQKVLTFNIVPYSISSDIKVDDISVAKPTGNKTVKVTPVVMLNGKKLKEGTDYVVSTSTSASDIVKPLSEAKTHKLYVVGINNYSGAVPFNFTITEKTLASKVTIKKIADIKYTGNALTPDLEVTYKIGGKVTDVADDFTVEYKNNTEIGTATAIITAKPESTLFAGSKSVTFKITGDQISKAKLSANGKGTIQSKVYDGNPYEPGESNGLTLYYGNESTPLVKDKDYTVTYTNNVNVGTATALVTGKGKYTGTKKLTYKITKYDAGTAPASVISVDGGKDIVVSYEKGGVTPKPTISMNGVTLTEKKDYTLKYANNKAVAKSDAKNANGKPIAPAITITFKGNLSGKRTVNFEITNKDIDDCKITIADKAHSTKVNAWKQTAVTIADTNGKKLKAGTDYSKTLKYYSDPSCKKEITAETLDSNTLVYVKVDGINNYDKSLVGSYRISKNNISKVNASIEPQTFTGSEICPAASEIKVWTGSGNNKTDLVAGQDYDIVPDSYTNNVNKGTATVTITGKGEYYGTKVVKFTIGTKKFLWWR